MKDKVKNSIKISGNQSQLCKIEFHSRHHKLVIRDLKTGRYAKKPNKH